MATCPSCGRENPDGFTFCGYCGAALGPTDRPRDLRKVVTVVFADVVGSTELGETRDPERGPGPDGDVVRPGRRSSATAGRWRSSSGTQ